MNYCNLNCTLENIRDVIFYTFKLDNISVKCFMDEKTTYFNVSDLTNEVEESVKNLLLDKYKNITVEASEFSGIYVEQESFVTIVSWVHRGLYRKYKKFLFFVNLYFTLKNVSDSK